LPVSCGLSLPFSAQAQLWKTWYTIGFTEGGSAMMIRVQSYHVSQRRHVNTSKQQLHGEASIFAGRCHGILQDILTSGFIWKYFQECYCKLKNFSKWCKAKVTVFRKWNKL
jgi:hypothetical protein